MMKALLLSVLVAVVVIPIWAARDPIPMRALKRTLFLTLGFNLLYAFLTLVVYPSRAFP